MLIIHRIPLSDLAVPEDRQRKEYDEQAIVELSDSIDCYSLLHPIIIRKEGNKDTLVAGWRRLQALKILWGTGRDARCGIEVFPENQVPCHYLGELDPIDAFAIELEENLKREDLSWQDRALALQKLEAVRSGQADRKGEPPVSPRQLSEEIYGQTGSQGDVRKELIVARNLHVPEVASAKNVKEAFKVLKRQEQSQRHAELAERLGPTFTSASHTLLQGDCTDLMTRMQPGTFDIILTDPPYGIDAQDFNDSGGKTTGGHFYDDSYETWTELMMCFTTLSAIVTKEQAHLYCFCDIDRFHELKTRFELVGWKVFRTPLTWVNPGGMRAPWPEMGPQRKTQWILYAVKGNRPATRLYGDVITCGSDPNLGHPAQKPVALLRDLLQRSVSPGDSVLDPFCGSGSIFPAGHALQCKVTGIEQDAAAAGIVGKRLEELK